MEQLRKNLLQVMARDQANLLYEVRKGPLSIEVTLEEEPGEISSLRLVEKEKIKQAVKEATCIIFGAKATVFDIYTKELTVFFTVTVPYS